MDALEQMIASMTQERSTAKVLNHPNRIFADGSDDICPICFGTGWQAFEDEDGYETYKECQCGIRRRSIIQSRKEFAELPDAFREMRLKSFSLSVYQSKEGVLCASKACKAVKYWLDNFDTMRDRGQGLYFFSATKGSGKTRLAASIANELLQVKGLRVKFATSMQIINEIKASWEREKQSYESSESRLLEFLSTADVLIIDDFGTEEVKHWISERFYQIINNRYANKLITIFTSNVSINNLDYDSRITNRILERSYSILFPEESVREYIAADNMQEMLNAIK